MDNQFEIGKLYTKPFYEGQQEGSLISGQTVIPAILEYFKPQSVVDVGCGVGSWLVTFLQNGIQDILGIDGLYVDQKMLLIPPSRFIPFDLQQPLRLDRKFDLAISMEVAEHIPEEKAESFVDSLTRLSEVILFSAAVPFQPGRGHVNARWPKYWQNMFQAKEFVLIDCLRNKFWDSRELEYWYAQNMFFFVQQNNLSNYPLLAKAAEQTNYRQLDIAHPELLYTYQRLQMKEIVARDNRCLGLEKVIAQYQENPLARPERDQMSQARKNLAHLFTNALEEQLEGLFTGEAGMAFRKILDCGIKNTRLTEEEKRFSLELTRMVFSGTKTTGRTQHLIALMLYYPAYMLPQRWYLDVNIPSWLARDFIDYLFKIPSSFIAVGEKDQYFHYYRELLEIINLNIQKNPQSTLWREMAESLAKNRDTNLLHNLDADLDNLIDLQTNILNLI